MFVDVHLNLETCWKDWPMGNKRLETDKCSYKLLSLMSISKLSTQIFEKVQGLLKVQILRSKKMRIDQFWVAVRNNASAISRIYNQSFSFIRPPHTELIQENVPWVFTAIIGLRWFSPLFSPKVSNCKNPFFDVFFLSLSL